MWVQGVEFTERRIMASTLTSLRPSCPSIAPARALVARLGLSDSPATLWKGNAAKPPPSAAVRAAVQFSI